MRVRVAMAVICLVAAFAGLPPAAAAHDAPRDAIPLGNGRYAVELKAPAPDWYTPELHRRVVAAGRLGKTVPIPPGVRAPQAALAFTGIRPGSWMVFPSWCTMTFVFGSRSDYYIGTAGHCAREGKRVTIAAAPGVLMSIGRTVKSVRGRPGKDFALVDVRKPMERYVNPSMAIVAGPTGSRAPRFGNSIVHVGHGVGVGAGGTARPGVVTYVDGTTYGWDGAASPGDSGSPVRHVGGRAAGNLTHLVVGTKYLPAYIAGMSINRMVEIAGRPLAKASLVPDPLH
jgi:hypothetical protein